MYVAPCPTLITRKDVTDILNCTYLYERNQVFYVDHNGTYDQLAREIPLVRRMHQIKDRYNAGHTILIKGLESWSKEIQDYAIWLGKGVDVHMYLSPAAGTSFDFHEDDTDVIIHRVYGEKRYVVQRGGVDLPYDMSDMHGIAIKAGERHKAINLGESCMLSFGIPHHQSYSVWN